LAEIKHFLNDIKGNLDINIIKKILKHLPELETILSEKETEEGEFISASEGSGYSSDNSNSDSEAEEEVSDHRFESAKYGEFKFDNIEKFVRQGEN